MKQLDFSPLYTPMSESEVQWFRQYDYRNECLYGRIFVIPESAMPANLKFILAPMVIFIYISFIALIRRHVRVLFDSGRATDKRYMMAVERLSGYDIQLTEETRLTIYTAITDEIGRAHV